MIKLESAHIEEVRGIRKLDIDFGGKHLPSPARTAQARAASLTQSSSA